MFKTTSYDILNKAINHCLQLDPDVANCLKPLQDKLAAIHIQGLDKTVYCQFNEDSVLLSDEATQNPHVKISGAPFSLLRIAMTKNMNVADITIDGDIETAQQLKDFIEKLDIDWEEQIARIAGDGPAYHLGKLGKKVKDFVKQRHTDFVDNLAVYLKDESHLLIAPEEIEQFNEAVDELNLALQRLQCHVENLEKTK